MPVLFALTAVLSTALGGFVALRSRDRLHLVLGFAAGVMLGLVAFDLLPELFELSDTIFLGVPTVMVAFAAGFLAAALRRAVGGDARRARGRVRRAPPPQPQRRTRVRARAGGALVPRRRRHRAGVPGHDTVGFAVALAVIAHDFADGLNTVTIMRTHGNSQRRQVTMLATDAVAPVVGAISTLFFSVSDNVLALYLGAFAGFLLYLATADILPEAHARHPSRLTLVSTLGGVGLMWFVVAAG